MAPPARRWPWRRPGWRSRGDRQSAKIRGRADRGHPRYNRSDTAPLDRGPLAFQVCQEGHRAGTRRCRVRADPRPRHGRRRGSHRSCHVASSRDQGRRARQQVGCRRRPGLRPFQSHQPDGACCLSGSSFLGQSQRVYTQVSAATPTGMVASTHEGRAEPLTQPPRGPGARHAAGMIPAMKPSGRRRLRPGRRPARRGSWAMFSTLDENERSSYERTQRVRRPRRWCPRGSLR